eukprot:CAMPEP_0170613800 /NCGR_PEP_ID=MMETSP0224-20130122/24464_1 /TAXON_ID=285029 /ORGANISM="Togula jolla, Strain CCCM 725" /LENGTH=120 /DNA_ID=CAMNT_0010939423 /DNA_START=83 /DNA_END=445 /DNA_ORIENTATION=-
MSCGQDMVRNDRRSVSFGGSSVVKYVPDDGATGTKQMLIEHTTEQPTDDEGQLSLDLIDLNERTDRKLRDRCATAIVYSQTLKGSVPAVASSKIWKRRFAPCHHPEESEAQVQPCHSFYV